MKYVLLLFLMLLAGCSDHIGINVSSTQSEIIDGRKVDHSQFPSVVSFASAINGQSICTGVLVKRDLVLTAAHCVSAKGGHDNVIVISGANAPAMMDDIDHMHRIFKVKRHPEYDSSKDYTEPNFNDIGVVVLEEPIKDAVCSPILEADQIDDFITVGDIVTIAGYGYTVPSGFDGGILYAADTVITNKYENEIVLGDSKTPNACHGDSGGPAYIDLFGVRYVAALTSRAIDVPVCETGAFYTLPGQYSKWIEDTYNDAIAERGFIPTAYCPYEPEIVSLTEYMKPSGGCSVSSSGSTELFGFLLVFGLLLWRKISIRYH